MNSAKKILFSANDPGGWNAILPVVRALVERGDVAQGILTGPALDQFRSLDSSSQYFVIKRSIGIIDGAQFSDNDLAREIAAFKPDVYLAASSIGNSIDKRIFKLLRNITSVYVVDFWSHYAHRFVEKQQDLRHMPTRICVIDERMKKMMLEERFPEERITITGNPHFDHFADAITSDHEDNTRAVFISQPIKQDKKHAGYADRGFDEFGTFESVIRCLPDDLHLSIRLHPRKKRAKFNAYLNDRITVGDEATLEEALSKAGLVIGMFSPVLMQSALAGKPTISYQPGNAEDPLPTNPVGITKLARNESELRALIKKYQDWQFPKSKEKVENIWPKGATERVVAVIDEIITGKV